MILTKKKRSKEDKKRIRIRKSEYIELDGTYYYIGKFNIALSLCRVLEVAFYFSEGFSESVTEVLQSLGVIIVYFLGQESNLWSFALQ